MRTPFILKLIPVFFLFNILANSASSAHLLIPMDERQKDHLKAYGITYWVLQNGIEAQWLLNYRGGSFMTSYYKDIESECIIRGVSYEVIADLVAQQILADIARPEVNMDAVKLETPPRIAVYSPKNLLPWDDAVTLALTYSEIPYAVIYDEEVLAGELKKYDWLHLHHEDFTGQYGKFYGAYGHMPWYQEEVKTNEELARKLGFNKVSQMKLAVALVIREYIFSGGFMFAMCSATDTYDIALAAEGVDICESMFDGDPADPGAQSKLDFNKTLAFNNFQLVGNPLQYEYSNIDATESRVKFVQEKDDYFALFDFSAKWDPVPTMLCQNHTKLVKGFMGQTTAFVKDYIKPHVLVMGENKKYNEARYIHSEFGKGTWTFLGGHDPEDYRHQVGEDPTDLKFYPNSPGYRLILNNILFPAAKKKKLKT
jgi:hypothetical protein